MATQMRKCEILRCWRQLLQLFQNSLRHSLAFWGSGLLGSWLGSWVYIVYIYIGGVRGALFLHSALFFVRDNCVLWLWQANK